MRNFIPIIVILTLTSCIKQEAFIPKGNSEYEVFIDFNLTIDSRNSDFQNSILNLLPDGTTRFFNPGEIEAYLIENNNKSYKGVFNGVNGFNGFVGFEKVISNITYELQIIYKGDTISAKTTALSFDEVLNGEVVLGENRNVNIEVEMKDGNDSFVYYASYLTNYVFNDYFIESNFSESLLKSGFVSINYSNKDCLKEPYTRLKPPIILLKVNKIEHIELAKRGRQFDYEFNPFYIPYTLENEFENNKIYGSFYSLVKKVEFPTYRDLSNVLTTVKILKNSNQINFSDSLPYPESFTLIYHDLEKHVINTTMKINASGDSLFRITENDYLTGICDKRNKSILDLGLFRLGVFCDLKDKTNRGYRTDTFYFNGDNLPNEIILKFNE